MRAFVALDLPDALLREVTRLQARLTVGREVPEENLHLTLAFLGDISEPQARDVAEAMAALTMPPVDVTLAGLDVMGGKEPTLIAAKAEASEPLVRLHDKVAQAVRGAGVTLERRRFRPHVTLARFSKKLTSRDQRALGEFLALNGAFRFDPHPAEWVTLYESHLTSEGSIYTPLAEQELG